MFYKICNQHQSCGHTCWEHILGNNVLFIDSFNIHKCKYVTVTNMVDAALAEGIAVSGVLVGVAIRTLIPYFNKWVAENQQAEAEGRQSVPPKFKPVYAVTAAITILLTAIPLLASINETTAKVMDIISPWAAFFGVVLSTMGVQQLLNMGVATGMNVQNKSNSNVPLIKSEPEDKSPSTDPPT